MSNKPRLVLHIGQPKAGSSRLQQFISDHIVSVQDAGFILCDPEVSFRRGLTTYLPPIEKLKHYALGEGDRSVLQDKVKAGAELIEDRSREALLISAENLAGTDYPRLFEGLDALFDIELVLYIRRRDDWLISSWGQWQAKSGVDIDQLLGRWCNIPRWKYKEILDYWQKAVTPAKIIVRPMHESAYKGGDQCLDFAYRIGWPCHPDVDLPGRVNAGLPFEVLWLQQEYPGLFASPHDNSVKDIIEAYCAGMFVKPGGDLIGYRRRKKIFDLHREEYDWFQERYFPDVDVDEVFGVSHIDPDTQPWRPDPKRLAATALAVSVAIARGQEERLNALTEQLKRLGGDIG